MLLVVLMQTITGMLKCCFPKSCRFNSHNKIGLIVWIIGCVNILLAGCFWSSPFYGAGIMGLSSLSVVGAVVTTLYIRNKSRSFQTPLLSVVGTRDLGSYDRIRNFNENADNRPAYTDV